jgi:phospholipid-binding lipoprotein MlaA
MTRLLAALLAAGLGTAALPSASALAGDDPPARTDHDPIEGVNRKIFWFNDKVDVYVLEPVATGWAKIAPLRVRNSVANFFTNVRTPIVAVNDLLQGKIVASGSDVGRFAVNTTVGVLGLFDPAARWGLEKHVEDFGQTLGVWGVPPGPYLVLPFLGSSTVRDTGGYALTVYPFFVDSYILFAPPVVEAVNSRSLVLQEVRDAKQASLDYYSFVRNAYLQRRDALVHDGAEPPQVDEEDLYNPDLGDH